MLYFSSQKSEFLCLMEIQIEPETNEFPQPEKYLFLGLKPLKRTILHKNKSNPFLFNQMRFFFDEGTDKSIDKINPTRFSRPVQPHLTLYSSYQ